MSDPALPQDLLSEIRELKRRLTALERSPQLISSSIKGGTLRVYNDSGVEFFTVGDVLIDGDTVTATGITMEDPSTGTPLFRISEDRGMTLPAIAYGWKEPNYSNSTTSTSWTNIWEARVENLHGDALRSDFVVNLTSGITTAEVKVVITSGPVETDAVEIDYATQAQWTFALRWDHGKNLGTGPFVVQLQARITAGSGTISVFQPYNLAIQDGYVLSATSGGLTAS